MARPKKSDGSVNETISKKIESIKNQITELENDLKHWEHVSSEYEKNKVSIESILSLHSAPDLSAPKTRSTKK